MRSRNIQAAILEFLSDNKLHNYQSIADEVECSYSTVRRHIEALSYRFNIQTFCGGVDIGGVKLMDKKVDVNYLKDDELKLIINQLELLQNSNSNIKKFIQSLSAKIEKEKENVQRII